MGVAHAVEEAVRAERGGRRRRCRHCVSWFSIGRSVKLKLGLREHDEQLPRATSASLQRGKRKRNEGSTRCRSQNISYWDTSTFGTEKIYRREQLFSELGVNRYSRIRYFHMLSPHSFAPLSRATLLHYLMVRSYTTFWIRVFLVRYCSSLPIITFTKDNQYTLIMSKQYLIVR